MINIPLSNVDPYEAAGLLHTQSKLIKTSFVWKIDNYSLMDDLESPLYSLVDIGKSIRLTIYPHTKAGILYQRNVELRMEMFNDNLFNDKITVKYKYDILDVKGLKILNTSTQKTIRFGYGWETSSRHSLIPRYTLITNSTTYLPQDTLTILCELKYLKDKVSRTFSKYQFNIPKSKLSDEFGELLKTEQLCDVTLNVVGQDFKAHKAILSGRSTVFAKMFKHEMEKHSCCKHDRVVITDIEPDVFKEMLYFIYTDRSVNVQTMVKKLLVAANQYGLERLTVMCSEVLYNNLKIETAIETIILADEHKIEELKSQTIKFIKFHSSIIMSTIEWKNMGITHPHLVTEINVT